MYVQMFIHLQQAIKYLLLFVVNNSEYQLSSKISHDESSKLSGKIVSKCNNRK